MRARNALITAGAVDVAGRLPEGADRAPERLAFIRSEHVRLRFRCVAQICLDVCHRAHAAHRDADLRNIPEVVERPFGVRLFDSGRTERLAHGRRQMSEQSGADRFHHGKSHSVGGGVLRAETARFVLIIQIVVLDQAEIPRCGFDHLLE